MATTGKRKKLEEKEAIYLSLSSASGRTAREGLIASPEKAADTSGVGGLEGEAPGEKGWRSTR
jgi:hypothetical protein